MATLETIQANASGKIRYEHMDDRDYIVVPASLIVPGVLNGSKGPLYYSSEETAKDPEAWNGMPLVVYHPKQGDKHVSARKPSILRRHGIGSVYEANHDGKLAAEAWFDIKKTIAYDAKLQAKHQMMPRLKAGTPIELSTGLFTKNIKAAAGASFNGVPYTHIARHLKPDHLAVLPDMVGACSVKDGCGFNVNTAAIPVHSELGDILSWLGVNYSKSYEDKRAELSGQLAKRFPPTKAAGVESIGYGSPWIIDMYDDYIVYDHKRKLWELGYKEEAGKCVLSSESPTEVRRVTSYEHVTNALPNQPRSQNTGAYKRQGAGTGKGEQHEAAQRGHMALSDKDKEQGKDAKTQADSGSNPPSWAVDEPKWEKAKAAADKGGYDGDTYWAVVAHIYSNMGGTIGSTAKAKEESTTSTADNAADNPTTNSTLEDIDMATASTTTLTREQTIAWLVGNCPCWKDGTDELEDLSDDRLGKLKANAEVLLAGGKAVSEIRKQLGAPKELAVNGLPAFIKEKMKGKKKKPDDDEEEEEEEEDEVENEEGQQRQPKTVITPAKPTKTKEWLAAMPDDIKPVWNSMVNMEKKQRKELCRKLAANANVPDDQREALANRLLKTKTLEQLQEMALFIPTTNQQQQRQVEEEQEYFGLGPDDRPAGNAKGDQLDQDDILQLPQMDWTVNDRKAVGQKA